LSAVPKPVWWGLGAVVLFALFSKRKEITVAAKKALTEAQKAVLRTVVPAQGEEAVDLAFELGPKYGINPLFILAFIKVESGFKLKANEHGDEFPRCVSRYAKDPKRAAWAAQLPGVKMIPNHTFKNPKGEMQTCDAWVPAKGKGWGIGLMQIDWMAHPEFLKRADAYTTRAQMDYAIKTVIVDAVDTLKKRFPGIDSVKLFEGVIAAYNAGPRGAGDAIAAGKDLKTVTAAPWYIGKVREHMNTLSTLFGGDSTDMFVA
jgi:soluble lytic murein transglycosylase-like protein